MHYPSSLYLLILLGPILFEEQHQEQQSTALNYKSECVGAITHTSQIIFSKFFDIRYIIVVNRSKTAAMKTGFGIRNKIDNLVVLQFETDFWIYTL